MKRIKIAKENICAHMKLGDIEEGIGRNEKGRSVEHGTESKRWQRRFKWGPSFSYFPSCRQFFFFFLTIALNTIRVEYKGNKLNVCWVWKLTSVFIQWDLGQGEVSQLFQRCAWLANQLLMRCHFCDFTCTGYPHSIVPLFSLLVDFTLPGIADFLKCVIWKRNWYICAKKIGMWILSLWGSSFKWEWGGSECQDLRQCGRLNFVSTEVKPKQISSHTSQFS